MLSRNTTGAMLMLHENSVWILFKFYWIRKSVGLSKISLIFYLLSARFFSCGSAHRATHLLHSSLSIGSHSASFHDTRTTSSRSFWSPVSSSVVFYFTFFPQGPSSSLDWLFNPCPLNHVSLITHKCESGLRFRIENVNNWRLSRPTI